MTRPVGLVVGVDQSVYCGYCFFMKTPDTRLTLIKTASKLFRRKGYSGVGLSEILTAAGLPKGSLYHHFPGGKPELAAAATRWAGAWIESLVQRSFEGAETFEEGAQAACRDLAATLVQVDHIEACPVLSVLQAASDTPVLQEAVQEDYARWTAELAHEARRLGRAQPDAVAQSLHIRLQGAWVMAYAQQSQAPFLHLADEIAAEAARNPAEP